MVGAVGDLTPSRPGLIAENALLRQQLIVLRRSIERPRLHHDDRLLLLILARLTRRWRDALHVVSPETLPRWHRDLLKIVWRRKSRTRGQPKRLAPESATLIQAMAKDNVLWGAERIRGELLKLGIRVSKLTIQKYMRHVRPPGQRGRAGTPSLATRAVTFGLATSCSATNALSPHLRLLIPGPRHAGSRSLQCDPRGPIDAWVAQQLQEATPYGDGPTYLIRDNDDKFERRFDAVA